MTRNHSNRTIRSQPSLTAPSVDNIVNLPDLSEFQENEKQHILNVLIRDEDLRQKHLARFLNLRKEVADLEQQSQTTSSSICARCQTPFGYIFNTGDACPKCAAKVCKQCRLMYNVNDNGWLCQLCCKQMQLMSYSGEWIYALHSNLRKDSATPSDLVTESLPPSISFQNITTISSSDSEPEDITRLQQKPDRFTALLPPSKKPKPRDPIYTMIIQNPNDVQKLNYVRERIEERPLNAAFTQPLPRRFRPRLSPSNTVSSPTEHTNSVISETKPRQDNLSITNNIEMPKTNQLEIARSELSVNVGSKKSLRNRLKIKHHSHSSHQNSKENLTSKTLAPTTRERLSLSMQSLRDTVQHISYPHLSSSRVSLNVDKKQLTNKSVISINNDDDSMSLKVPSIPSRTTSRTNLQTPQSSFDDTKLTRFDSTDTYDSQSKPRTTSVTDSESNRETRPKLLAIKSSALESEDDIDKKFETAKLGPTKRSNSYVSLFSSKLSINSMRSEAKARYELEITGTIQIKLTYNMQLNALDIFIKKCTNLAMSKRQSPNPYCKSYLLPDKSKGSKRKTTVKKATIDPVFNETLRYNLSLQEFDSRTVWVSVWSEASLSQNDFLGEIHIPLANCRLDELQEYTLLPRVQEENQTTTIEPTSDKSELYFELSFIEHPKTKGTGTIQVNSIHGSGIYYGKQNVDAICKGVIMPDKHKRKLPISSKGPSPKWDIPLRWENMSLEKLKTTSLELSIWHQERFRKFMIGFVRLNSIQPRPGTRLPKSVEATPAESLAWEKFQLRPKAIHKLRLPLRPPTAEQK